MNTEKKVQCYKMTFEAIQAVRKELADTAMDDTIKVSEIMLRLSGLYASIDAAQFVECMSELEAQTSNVVKVDFRAKKLEEKQPVAVNQPFTYDDIPF